MMRSQMRGDGVRSPISPPSRSPSVSSLNSSSNLRFTLRQPPHPDLPAAYVAAAAASEIVTSLHSQPEREDDPSFDRTAVFSDEALALVNTFLDFLLFNTLSAARSPALDPVRRAVEHIVKGKLGQQAVQCGESELEELINDEDETDLASIQRSPDLETHWDSEAAWRRTRLKIFTYMRLSEMEDDEEEDEMDEHGSESDQASSRRTALVSWPATIFLTGVLERIAEQCVRDAGESAFNRQSVSRPSTRQGTYFDDEDLLVVSEQDVKKLALSQLAGRLWRTWKHTLPRGSPRLSQLPWKQVGHERGSSGVSDATFTRRPSNALEPITDEVKAVPVQEVQEPAAQEPVVHVEGPKSPRPHSDQTANRTRLVRHAPRRSRSFGRFPVVVPGRSDRGSWQTPSPRVETASEQRLSRMRSSSLPPPTLQTTNLRPADPTDAEPASASAAVSEEKRRSRNSRDMAAQAARAAPQAAETTMAERSGKRLSREMRGSQKRRSKEVRRSREVAPPPVQEPVQAVREEPTAQNLQPPAQAASTSGPSDDEYDPFRADVVSPPIAKPARTPTSEQPTKAPRPVQETLRQMSQRDSMGQSPEPDAGPTATLADGAISTALFGSTSQSRKTKKPAPLDMSATTTANTRAQRREAQPQVARTPSDGRHAKPLSAAPQEVIVPGVSPAQASAGRAEESRTPSSSKLQRTATSDTSSAPFHTPRGSPTPYEERPAMQTRTSDPAYNAMSSKATSPRLARNGVEGAAHKHHMKGSDKEGSLSARSDKEFNDLMSGNQTVKRSLTPKALTDIEAVDSPTLRQQQVKSIYGPHSPMATQFPISEGNEAAASSSEAVAIPKKKSSNIGALRQAAEARVADTGAASSSKPSRNGWVARDAREQTYRTNDIADFARSTAPTSPDQAPRLVSPSATGSKAASPTTPSIRTPSNYQQPSLKSVVPNTSRAAQKIQMRPARLERQANDDLISFLNEGPPGAHVTKSRSMETTGSGLGTMSPANRSSSQMSQSINESVNSHSGLLPKTMATDRSAMMNAAVSRAPPPKPMEGGPPARKQRRVKDPYAIDTDDEDEDVLTGLPAKEEGDSMGLVDFLRSTAPPEDNAPSGPAAKRLGSPPKKTNNARKNEPRIGTSSTAVGGPRPMHKQIPSNEEIKRDPGDFALPHFLKEERQVRPRDSYDSEPGPPSRKGRSSSKGSDAARGGMRGLFKRIGVNG